jgi:hypothetical protein
MISRTLLIEAGSGSEDATRARITHRSYHAVLNPMAIDLMEVLLFTLSWLYRPP